MTADLAVPQPKLALALELQPELTPFQFAC